MDRTRHFGKISDLLIDFDQGDDFGLLAFRNIAGDVMAAVEDFK